MISITPQGQVYLCKTPLINDYKNQLTFANKNAQLTYFNSTIQKTYDNYTYIKKDNVIKVGENIDNLIQCNYLFYKNTGFTDKWYFCFITNMEYINENCTAITIETDVFQTWYFDIVYKPCFIEREHVNDDTIGIHTIDENLNVGEVIEEGQIEDASYGNEIGYYVCIASNWEIKDNSTGWEILDRNKGTQYAGISVYDNVVFGTRLYLFSINSLNDFRNVYLFISRSNMDKHIEDIQNIFIVPNLAVNVSQLTSHTASMSYDESETALQFTWYTLPYDTSIETFDTVFEKLHSFSDFQPKNNKCFVYPYNYLFVSNNQGNNNIFKYENFEGNNVTFENQFCITIGGSGRLVPKNYKGMPTDDDEALPLGKYPTCAWSSDAFTNWLTQNSVNLATQTALMAGNIALGVATGGASIPATTALSALATANSNGALSDKEFKGVANTASMGINTAGQIGGIIGQFYQASLMPNLQGGQATGDVIWGANRNMYTLRQMRSKTEYLKAIDDYFSMFGYKVNIVKTPNITGRQNWNYIKTINCNAVGDIPQTDLNIIRNMFNSGVTLWHNASTMYNYNNSNNIV